MDYLTVIGALIFILAALLLGLQLVKKYVPSVGGAKDLAVVEQLHLGDRCRVIVVKVREEELLIGVTRETVSILEKLSR